jgi:hypothetical protein
VTLPMSADESDDDESTTAREFDAP